MKCLYGQLGEVNRLRVHPTGYVFTLKAPLQAGLQEIGTGEQINTVYPREEIFYMGITTFQPFYVFTRSPANGERARREALSLRRKERQRRSDGRAGRPQVPPNMTQDVIMTGYTAHPPRRSLLTQASRPRAFALATTPGYAPSTGTYRG